MLDANLKQQFMWPVLTAIVVSGVLVALGVRVWSSGICFALSAFVAGTLVQEFVRGARVRQQYSGSDLLSAGIGLVSRNQRRYGGYIVHLGIVLMALGFAGEGFKQEEQLLMKPGQSVTVGAFTVRHDGIAITQDAQKQMVTARMTAFQGGKELGGLAPAKWFYNKRTEEPTTEPTTEPTVAPTAEPTAEPTAAPSPSPSVTGGPAGGPRGGGLANT